MDARLLPRPQHVRIGGRDTPASGLAEFFNGLIDDVAVWSRALSADEISALYERGVRGVGAMSAQEPSTPAAKLGQGPAPAIRLLGTNAVPTVAILPVATDDVTRAAADLLQQKLVGDGVVKVVERAELEKVLKEQTLQAAFGSGAVSERIKLGGLLRADVLVFLERPDGGGRQARADGSLCRRDPDGPARRPRDHRLGTKKPGQGDPTSGIRSGEGCRPPASGLQHDCCRAAFECRDISVDYLYLRKPYARLAERFLLARPGVLVVDIEDADALARESFLSSSPAQIERPRPYYLRGSYRNDGLGLDRSISVELTLEQGRSSVGTERMDGLKEQALAEAFDGALSKLVGKLAPSLARTRLAGQQEARLLTEQGKAIWNTGSVLEAIPFFETASLLDTRFAEPRLQLFMAYSELDVKAYRRKAEPTERLDLREKALSYLETALPYWQGNLNWMVTGDFGCYTMFPVFSEMSYRNISDRGLQTRYREMLRRMAELGARVLESPAELTSADYFNLGRVFDDSCRELSEFNSADGLAIRARIIAAYARRPQGFSYCYGLIRDWLDQDKSEFRARLEKSEDKGTMLALRIYDLAKKTRELKSLNQSWPDIVLAAGDNQDLRGALAAVREDEVEPFIQPKEPEPVELYVDDALPPVVLERLTLGATGKIHDWMTAGEHGEYIAAEQGVFRLTPGGQTKKVVNGDTGRLVWDGLYIWAVQEGVISVLDAGGAGILNIRSEDLNYSIHSGELKLVPLEPGWMCLIGNAEQEGTLRRWVTTVDIRGKPAGKPIVDTFFQTSATRKEFLQNDWALKWKGGPPYIVLTRAAQINVSERTVSDYRRELDGMCTFHEQRHVPHKTALEWRNTILLVDGSRDMDLWPRSQVVSAILELPALGQQPKVWLMHPPGLNLNPGSAPRAHRAVFIADGCIHFILEPEMRPAWFATDLKTKETHVVSYDLPMEIGSYRTAFNAYTSGVFGIVMTVEGKPYKAKLPPSKRWAFFGSPKEYHDHLVADPATVAHRLSCMTLTNVQELVARHGNLNEQDEMGWSLVFYAVERNDAEMLNALLDGGADLKVTTRKGATAVMFAAARGNAQGLLALLEHGADPDFRADKRPPALLLAVRSRHPDCVRILLEHSADPNLPNTKERLAPLHVAAYRGMREAAELLLEAGANPNAHNSSGHTPLHFAAVRGYAEIVRLLLDHGADPSLKAPSLGGGGRMLTARDFAHAAKHHDVLRILDEHISRTGALSANADRGQPDDR